MLVAAAVCVAQEIEVDIKKYNPGHVAPRPKRAAILAGVERVLPLTSLLTFILVPSIATRIFKTFLCDRFEYDFVNGTVQNQRYMQDDLAISCESPEYEATETAALVFVFIWPIGVPVLYALLLWASRKALLTQTATPLSRATAFLSADCDSCDSSSRPQRPTARDAEKMTHV